MGQKWIRVICAVGLLWAAGCEGTLPDCEPGQFRVTDDSAVAGTAGFETCAVCAPGSFCAGGDASPVDCVPGETFDDDFDSRTPCVPLEPCPPGTADERDPGLFGRECRRCAPGGFCSGTEPRVECEFGVTYDDDQSAETPCVAVTLCAGGTVQVEPATLESNIVCEPCPENLAESAPDGRTCTGITGVARERVVLGGSYGCAYPVGGDRPECWGDNGFGQSSDVPDVTFDDLYLVSFVGCGRRESDGVLECWGRTGTPLREGLPSVPVRDVALGREHGCAIRQIDSEVECWGGNTYDQLAIPTDLGPVERIEAHFDTTCTLDGAGRVRCWGRADLSTEELLSDIQLRQQFGCGLRRSDGTPVCFGSFRFVEELEQTPTVPLESFALSRNSACGIRRDNGQILCWGDEDDELLRFAPYGVVLDELAVGDRFMCATTFADELLYCWGTDNHMSVTGVPGHPSLARRYQQIESGGQGFCGQDASGAWYCYGRPLAGRVPEADEWSVLGRGADLLCGLTADGSLECKRLEPALLPPESETVYSDLAVATSMTCVRRASDGRVECFGDDSDDVVSDVPEIPLDSIETGDDEKNACGLSGGNPVCWGTDDNNLVSRIPFGDFSDVRVGGTVACAKHAGSGSIDCWGEVIRDFDFPAGTPVTEFTLGWRHGCAIIEASSDLTCWAYREDDLALRRPEGLRVTALDAVGSRTCGLREGTDTAVCWGTLRVGW